MAADTDVCVGYAYAYADALPARVGVCADPLGRMVVCRVWVSVLVLGRTRGSPDRSELFSCPRTDSSSDRYPDRYANANANANTAAAAGVESFFFQ